MSTLFIFDLDGTLSVEPRFYRQAYSGSLTHLIEEQRGDAGLKTLEYYRQTRQGKGELALSELNIPFALWAERLCHAPVNLIQPQKKLVQEMRSLSGKKVVYTGSPIVLARRILERLGFCADTDFDTILGWEEPELFPVKWSCSPVVFALALQMFGYSPKDTWCVGDDWETDLLPAQHLGMNTVCLKEDIGSPTKTFPDVLSFISFAKKQLAPKPVLMQA